MPCVHAALDALDDEAKLAATARGSVADKLNGEVDACLRAIREGEPLQALQVLSSRMCKCQSDSCRKAVAKDVVRVAVVDQRFSGIQGTETFAAEKKKLDACYGGSLFE